MMGNLLQDFVASEDMDFEDRKWVWMRYGALFGSSNAETPFKGNLAERTQIWLASFLSGQQPLQRMARCLLRVPEWHGTYGSGEDRAPNTFEVTWWFLL